MPTATDDAGSPEDTASPDRTPALAVAAAVIVLHLATASDDWDFFRDELYYLANGAHVGLGYVDHPPMIGWIAWLVRAVLGQSQLAVRLLPALAGGATVYFAARTARVLGGGTPAQILAGVATGLAPLSLALCGFLSMNPFDTLIWTVACWALARRFAEDDPRHWLTFGAVAGIGLLNKISVLFLGTGVAVGLVLARRFSDVRSRWPWLGLAVAAVLFLPHVGWQIVHDWPTLEFIANATGSKNRRLSPLEFAGAQLEQMGPTGAVLFVAGLVFLLGSRAGRPFRTLGWTIVAVLVLLMAQNAKAYYFGPTYPLGFAAGAAMVERWVGGMARALVRAAIHGLVIALVVVGGVVALPLVKPVLSVDGTVAYMRALGMAPSTSERKQLGRLPQHLADRLGWRELAEAVAEVHRGLPEADRELACVYGQNYGQAGAIDLYGPGLGLPPAISGHNSYWLWGPGACSGEVLIIIGGRPEDHAESFRQVERGGSYRCADCMPYEARKEIWVARGLRGVLDEVWGRTRNFN